jgi:hypothetical protein
VALIINGTNPNMRIRHYRQKNAQNGQYRRHLSSIVRFDVCQFGESALTILDYGLHIT